MWVHQSLMVMLRTVLCQWALLATNCPSGSVGAPLLFLVWLGLFPLHQQYRAFGGVQECFCSIGERHCCRCSRFLSYPQALVHLNCYSGLGEHALLMACVCKALASLVLSSRDQSCVFAYTEFDNCQWHQCLWPHQFAERGSPEGSGARVIKILIPVCSCRCLCAKWSPVALLESAWALQRYHLQ